MQTASRSIAATYTLVAVMLSACGGASERSRVTDPDPELPDAAPADAETDSAVAPGVDAATMAVDMGFGANIGNTLENTYIWETGWGQPLITQQFINGMAANGIKTVRLPVAWDTYSNNGLIPDDKMARVRQVVQWILDADLYCIVNIHWDGGWIRNDETENRYQLTNDVRAKFQSYWQQIATEFADVGERLVFEAMNEEGEFYVNGNPSGARDYEPLNELNQSFVNTVRDSGGYNATRNLLISGFTTDIDRTCVDEFDIPTDPAGTGKLLLSVHYYTPFPFTIMSEPANWGYGWVYPATTWGTASEQAELKGLFDKLAAFLDERGVPAIIGEFNVTTGGGGYVRETESRVLWLKSVIGTAMSHQMVPIIWDTGGEFSRTDGSRSDVLTTVMNELDL